VGSLPRSQAVTDVVFAREKDGAVDPPGAAKVLSDAVRDVVRRQVEAGIDVVSDGEMSKISYATYIRDRITGFEGDTPREPGLDLIEFPRLLQKLASSGATAKYRRPRCVGPIAARCHRALPAERLLQDAGRVPAGRRRSDARRIRGRRRRRHSPADRRA
jgi:5-methyltetrahydropteroyltriglutamate--homocysteine methyltransferase